EGDVLVPRERLQHLGLNLYRIERGGLVTYHGPGQLVAYPIFQLRSLKVGLVDFVRHLEKIIMATLADFGLESQVRPGHPGVFIDHEKIASIGLAVRHGITFHGLALNYATDLSHFDLINPCGLTDTGMTSMERRLGRPVDPRRLRAILAGHFARTLGLELRPWTLKEAERTVDSYVSTQAKAAVA
ncbi:MAG: lipoyl(octanoyl) transferase LipB, partial [Pseudomonadota bacterium]